MLTRGTGAYVALSEPATPPDPRAVAAGRAVALNLGDAVSRSWTSDDGLPSIVTLALAQGPDGIVWIGTEHGLARYDGRRFEVAIERVAVSALEVVGRDLWVATSEGLARVVDGAVSKGTDDETLHSAPLKSLASAGTSLFVGTPAGALVELQEGRVLRRWASAEGLPATAIARLLVVDDRVFVGGEHGLRIVDRASGIVAQAQGDLAHATITGLARDGASTLVTTFDHGLFRCTGARCEPVSLTGVDAGVHLGQPLVLGDDTLLVPTSTALAVVRSGAVVARHPAMAGSLACLTRDRDGSIWIGAGNDGRAGGLRVLRSRGVRTWLRGRDGRAILEQPDGSVLLATNSDGLFRRAPNGSEGPVALAVDKLQSVRSLQPDPSDPGAALVAGLGGALRLHADGTQEVLTTGALPSSRIRAVRRLDDGRLLLATQAGLLVGTEAGAFTAFAGAPSTWFALGLIPHGGRDAEWLVPTSDDGLWRIPHAGGAPARVELAPWVGSVGRPLVHASGHVVVPHDSGVCVLDAALAVEACFGVTQGFALKGHVGLVDDARGNLWLSHTGGVTVVAWSELLEAAARRSPPPTAFRTLRHLTTRDGLPSNGCNGGDANAVRLANGELVFACMGGFAVVDPARAVTDPRPPSVFVHEVDVDGARQTSALTEALPASTQRVTFAFGAPSFLGNEEAQRFRVKLEGFDRDWVEGDRAALRASYTNLPRGRALTFLVKASNHDGVWNEAPAAVRFTIAPKLYERLPVQLAALAAIAGLLTAAYKARTRALKERARVLEDLVAERTVALEGALRDLRDDLAEARRFQELTMATRAATPGLDLASRWLPASTVGGDLFLGEPRPRGYRLLLVDATGHGVQAALRTMVLKTAFDAISPEAETPGDLLTKLNAMLVASYGEFEAKTDAIAVDVVRNDDGELTLRVATAGSLSLALVHEGSVRELRVPGFALGVTAARTYTSLEAPFPPRAFVALVTDGVLEQTNGAREAFDWPRFEAACLASRGTADERAAAIASSWSDHRGDAPQLDDATILVLTHAPVASHSP
jgi:serine phosphatase RsbU (regulator of sigma subunit)